MAISQHEARVVCQRSGNRCAFPGCRRLLATRGTDGIAVLGELAHIVAERPTGPRGASPLSLEERNRAINLILLCNVHHQLVDDKPVTYTVERLLGMKVDHERWVDERLGSGVLTDDTEEVSDKVQETIHSTVLPVERMPRFVYGVACDSVDEAAVQKLVGRPANREMIPFVLREGWLFAFQDLQLSDGPFASIVAGQDVQRFRAREWWDDPNRSKWFVDLTNRALNKLTGRRNLWLDKDHRRYYFQAAQPNLAMSVVYRPLNVRTSTREVVWQPITKRTGQPKGYYLHRAVSLRFLRIGLEDWCLSMRPELRVTVDGFVPYPSEEVGRRVTKAKARRFNYDLLGEVNFWRDYLSESQPQIIFPFGRQSLVISTTLMRGSVTWPGIPEEHAMPFRNVEYLDTLFSWAERAAADDAAQELNDDEEWDEESEDDIVDEE